MIRASDRDREHVVARLGVYTSEGRLTLTEFEERASTAYAATYLSDLDALLADLPVELRSEVGVGARARADRDARSLAVRGPWVSWAFVGTICLIMWAVVSVAQARLLYFWPVWVIGPWGIMLLRHTLGGRRFRSYR